MAKESIDKAVVVGVAGIAFSMLAFWLLIIFVERVPSSLYVAYWYMISIVLGISVSLILYSSLRTSKFQGKLLGAQVTFVGPAAAFAFVVLLAYSLRVTPPEAADNPAAPPDTARCATPEVADVEFVRVFGNALLPFVRGESSLMEKLGRPRIADTEVFRELRRRMSREYLERAPSGRDLSSVVLVKIRNCGRGDLTNITFARASDTPVGGAVVPGLESREVVARLPRLEAVLIGLRLEGIPPATSIEDVPARILARRDGDWILVSDRQLPASNLFSQIDPGTDVSLSYPR